MRPPPRGTGLAPINKSWWSCWVKLKKIVRWLPSLSKTQIVKLMISNEIIDKRSFVGNGSNVVEGKLMIVSPSVCTLGGM